MRTTMRTCLGLTILLVVAVTAVALGAGHGGAVAEGATAHPRSLHRLSQRLRVATSRATARATASHPTAGSTCTSRVRPTNAAFSTVA